MSTQAYLRIFNALKQQILNGRYLPGQRIPAERELCEQFGVSRITARHALRLLTEQGMLDRHPGRGSYVRSARPVKLPILQEDFSGSIRREAPHMKRKLLSKNLAVPSPYIADTLGLLKTQKCLVAQRLDYLQDEPLAYDIVYIPLSLADSINDQMLARIDFVEIWLRAERLSISHTAESIEARIADLDATRILGIDASSPLLTVIDTMYTTDGRAAAVFESVYRADRFKLISTVKRSLNND